MLVYNLRFALPTPSSALLSELISTLALKLITANNKLHSAASHSGHLQRPATRWFRKRKSTRNFDNLQRELTRISGHSKMIYILIRLLRPLVAQMVIVQNVAQGANIKKFSENFYGPFG